MDVVKVDTAPQAIGPYSQAVKTSGLIFCSGQVSLNKEGSLVGQDAAQQTTQVMENLKAVLEGAGSSFEKVVKTTIYLVDMNDFEAVNQVYGAYFQGEEKPARVTVGVASLPKGARVEIECIAEIGYLPLENLP